MSDTKAIEVNKAELRRIQQAINQVGRGQIQPFFQLLGQVLVSDYRLGFKQSKSPADQSWAPIHHREGEPLRDTGDLQKSITAQVGGKTLEIGTNKIYGPTHQFGGPAKVQIPEHTRLVNQAFGRSLKFGVYATVRPHSATRNITPRPFLGIEKRQRTKVLRVFQHYIQQVSGGEVKA